MVLDASGFEHELAAWDVHMGEVNRDLVSAQHNAREHAIELVKLAGELKPVPVAEPSASEELAHRIRLQWLSEGRLVADAHEIERLQTSLADADARADRAAARAARAEAAARAANDLTSDTQARLDALMGTRRWQLASRAAAPFDRLRGR